MGNLPRSDLQLCIETITLSHGTMIRLAPPLVISEDDLDWGLDRIEDVLL